MNSDELKIIIDRAILGEISEADVQILINAIKSGRLILNERSGSAKTGKNAVNSIVVEGDNNTVYVDGPFASKLRGIVHKFEIKKNTFLKEYLNLFGEILDILKNISRPLLVGSGGLFIFFLAVYLYFYCLALEFSEYCYAGFLQNVF